MTLKQTDRPTEGHTDAKQLDKTFKTRISVYKSLL